MKDLYHVPPETVVKTRHRHWAPQPKARTSFEVLLEHAAAIPKVRLAAVRTCNETASSSASPESFGCVSYQGTTGTALQPEDRPIENATHLVLSLGTAMILQLKRSPFGQNIDTFMSK